jgi:hypothetical protein
MIGAVRERKALAFVRVNPLEHEEELKRFMVANGYVTFPDFFDRGYPSAVRDGAATWVALDDERKVRLSITCFPHTMALGERRLLVGMLGNLMADEGVRTFFPAVALVRRLLADVRAEGRLDLVCTDGTAQAAAIFKGAGMRVAGHLERFVFPVRERRLHVDAAIRAYQVWRRIRGPRLAPIAAHVAAEFDAAPFDAPIGISHRLRPHHSFDVCRRRLPGYPGTNDHWFTFPCGERYGSTTALVRWPDEDGLAVLHAIRRPSGAVLTPIVNALVRALRKRGAQRLQVCTLRESVFARELIEAGFIPRGDPMPILVHPLSLAGENAVRAVADWEITSFDMER